MLTYYTYISLTSLILFLILIWTLKFYLKNFRSVVGLEPILNETERWYLSQFFFWIFLLTSFILLIYIYFYCLPHVRTSAMYFRFWSKDFNLLDFKYDILVFFFFLTIWFVLLIFAPKNYKKNIRLSCILFILIMFLVKFIIAFHVTRAIFVDRSFFSFFHFSFHHIWNVDDYVTYGIQYLASKGVEADPNVLRNLRLKSYIYDISHWRRVLNSVFFPAITPSTSSLFFRIFFEIFIAPFKEYLDFFYTSPLETFLKTLLGIPYFVCQYFLLFNYFEASFFINALSWFPIFRNWPILYMKFFPVRKKVFVTPNPEPTIVSSSQEFLDKYECIMSPF